MMSRKSILVRSIEALCDFAVRRAEAIGRTSIHVEDVLATILPDQGSGSGAPRTLPRSALWLHQCAPMSFFPISITAVRGEGPDVSLAGIPVTRNSPMCGTISDLVGILMALDQITTALDRHLGEAGTCWIGSNVGFWLALNGHKSPVSGVHALHGRSAVDIICKLAITLGADPRDGIGPMCDRLRHDIPATRLELRMIESWSPYNLSAALTHVSRHERLLDALLQDSELRSERESLDHDPGVVLEFGSETPETGRVS